MMHGQKNIKKRQNVLQNVFYDCKMTYQQRRRA